MVSPSVKLSLFVSNEKAPDDEPFHHPKRPSKDRWMLPVMFGPNISGGFNANNGKEQNWSNYFFADGAFFCNGESDPRRGGNAGGSGGGGRIKISASGSSSIYGGSSTVQPSAIRFLPAIKI